VRKGEGKGEGNGREKKGGQEMGGEGTKWCISPCGDKNC